MNALNAALAYAKLGIRVFPIGHKTKVPLIEAWPDQASTDVDTITTWWNKTFKGAGIGIATGKSAKGLFFVLDVAIVNKIRPQILNVSLGLPINSPADNHP